jgi:hypothetical protein
MTRNTKPGLPRAEKGPMGAPQRFWGVSVSFWLFLAFFVTRDHKGYELYLINFDDNRRSIGVFN